MTPEQLAQFRASLEAISFNVRLTKSSASFHPWGRNHDRRIPRYSGTFWSKPALILLLVLAGRRTYRMLDRRFP